MGFIQTKNQFYLLRFLLGAAEAGFFPGIIVYLSHWFRYQDRAKVLALFMAAQQSLFLLVHLFRFALEGELVRGAGMAMAIHR